MYTKLPFDIIRDIAPVTTVTFSPYLLTTHPSVPVKTVAELIALARKNPGKLNVPVGLGSTIHPPHSRCSNAWARSGPTFRPRVVRTRSSPHHQQNLQRGKKLTSLGSRPQAKTPQEMGTWLASEKERWAKVVKESGYKIE